MKARKLSEIQANEIVGGVSVAVSKAGRTKEAYCGACKKIRIFDVYSGGRAYCRSCGKPEV